MPGARSVGTVRHASPPPMMGSIAAPVAGLPHAEVTVWAVLPWKITRPGWIAGHDAARYGPAGAASVGHVWVKA